MLTNIKNWTERQNVITDEITKMSARETSLESAQTARRAPIPPVPIQPPPESDLYGEQLTPTPLTRKRPPPVPLETLDERIRDAVNRLDNTHRPAHAENTNLEGQNAGNIPMEDIRRMQERLAYLEAQRARDSQYSESLRNSRHHRRSRHHINANGTISTPSVMQPVIPVTPLNIDGMNPLLNPSFALDVRTLLWPHVSVDMIKNIMANKLEVTKLYLLIPSDFRPSLDLRITSQSEKNNEDDDDFDTRAARRTLDISTLRLERHKVILQHFKQSIRP